MIIVLVSIKVKPEFIDLFRIAIIDNSIHSLEEPGIARFDILQEKDDPMQFILVEAYRDLDAQVVHKNTTHYQKWRDTVVEMMAVPRTSKTYKNVISRDSGWD